MRTFITVATQIELRLRGSMASSFMPSWNLPIALDTREMDTFDCCGAVNNSSVASSFSMTPLSHRSI